MFLTMTEFLYFRHILGKWIAPVKDRKMKGQVNSHILIKKTNGFVYILACCKRHLRLAQKGRTNITKFTHVRIA